MIEEDKVTKCNDTMMDANTADKLRIHKMYCDKIHELYEIKNSDYGDSVNDTFKKFGMDAFLVRLYDKLNRAYTLTRPYAVAKVKSEKLEDTLLDLANYALIALTLLEFNKNNNGGNNEYKI